MFASAQVVAFVSILCAPRPPPHFGNAHSTEEHPKGRNAMKRAIVIVAATAAFGALISSPALAGKPHFIGSRSCTFSLSTGDLTCSFKVAGLGNVSQATIQL